MRGCWPDWRRPVVGVGGTRSPTVETFCLVSNVVREIAASGAIVISGGVPGVDIAAHFAAVDVRGGATVSVLANPVEMGLGAHEWSSTVGNAAILKRGAFISEYQSVSSLNSVEFSERLLARDRLISGLCDIFLMFECSEDSATVDTARRAYVQGKTVVCVQSFKRSRRTGVDQFKSEFPVKVFDEREQEPSQIAAQIVEILSRLVPAGYLKHTAHSLSLAQGERRRAAIRAAGGR